MMEYPFRLETITEIYAHLFQHSPIRRQNSREIIPVT